MPTFILCVNLLSQKKVRNIPLWGITDHLSVIYEFTARVFHLVYLSFFTSQRYSFFVIYPNI